MTFNKGAHSYMSFEEKLVFTRSWTICLCIDPVTLLRLRQINPLQQLVVVESCNKLDLMGLQPMKNVCMLHVACCSNLTIFLGKIKIG